MIPEKPPEKFDTDETVQRLMDWFKHGDRTLVVGVVLLIAGFVGMVVFQSALFTLLLWVGVILLVVRLAPRLSHILGGDQVIDFWGTLISEAQGRNEGVLADTEEFLHRTKAPDVDMEYQEVSPGLLRSLLGTKRSFLVIRNTSNPNLRPYCMYINARDYGTNLQVSWYLVLQPSFWQKFKTFLLYVPFINLLILPFHLIGRLTTAKDAGLLGLDLFDEQDLRAYVTNAHHCFLAAVDKVMLDLNQDPSTVDRRSRGFLGIS